MCVRACVTIIANFMPNVEKALFDIDALMKRMPMYDTVILMYDTVIIMYDIVIFMYDTVIFMYDTVIIMVFNFVVNYSC